MKQHTHRNKVFTEYWSYFALCLLASWKPNFIRGREVQFLTSISKFLKLQNLKMRFHIFYFLLPSSLKESSLIPLFFIRITMSFKRANDLYSLKIFSKFCFILFYLLFFLISQQYVKNPIQKFPFFSWVIITYRRWVHARSVGIETLKQVLS